MDAEALQSVRRILGLPRGAVNALVMDAEVHFLPFLLRLFFSLRLHPLRHSSPPRPA